MKTEHPMYRSPRNSLVCVASLLALSVIKSAVATAGSKTDNSADSLSETISVAGLDLSTVDGFNAARNRVHQVARKLCLRLANPADRSSHWNYVRCVDDAVATAMQQASPSRGLVAKTAVGQHHER